MLLAEKLELSQSVFEGESFKPVMTSYFHCLQCGEKNSVVMRPYVADGFQAFNEYYKTVGLTAELIEEKGVALKNPPILDFLGEYSVANLHALAKNVACEGCNTRYLVVAGCGELQPGRMMCVFSGVWRIV